MDEKQEPINETPLDVLSELFKASAKPQADLVNDAADPVDALYRQAVKVAEEMNWEPPSWPEFEAQYRREIESRQHE